MSFTKYLEKKENELKKMTESATSSENIKSTLLKPETTELLEVKAGNYMLSYIFGLVFAYVLIIFLFGYRETHEKSLYTSVSFLLIIILVKFGLKEVLSHYKIVTHKHPFLEVFFIIALWTIFTIITSSVKKHFPETTNKTKQRTYDIERKVILLFIFTCLFFLFKLIILNSFTHAVYTAKDIHVKFMLNLAIWSCLPLTLFITDLIVYRKFI